MKKTMLQLLFGIIIIIALIVGLKLSGQNGTASISMTDNLLVKAHILSADEVQNKTGNYANYSFMIRKLGHFTLYALSSCFIFLWIYSLTGSITVAFIGSLFIVFAYANFDEFRQRGVDGRTFNKIDITIDMLGAGIAVFIASLGVGVGRMKAGEKRSRISN